MSFGSNVVDVALIGTGVAPLVAAYDLISQDKSVLLLNPDPDFFLEDSELSLDPLLPQGTMSVERLSRGLLDASLAELRSAFPGAVEQWPPPGTGKYSGFHDVFAPHVRSRSRIWIAREHLSEGQGPGTRNKHDLNWESLEDFYVDASDAQLVPQILDGIAAVKKFPGFMAGTGAYRGLVVPKLWDADVTRYRNGLLEFIRERLDLSNVVCNATQLDYIPSGSGVGLRFHDGQALRTALVNQGTLVFWTPRMTPIVAAMGRSAALTNRPKGVRLWEQWALNSRDPLDPAWVGMFEDMAVWAEVEGAPLDPIHLLTVLKAGPLVSQEEWQQPRGGVTWASSDSFQALSRLFHGFMRWDRFSVRSMRARAVFEWERSDVLQLRAGESPVLGVTACDGPLADVIRVARGACDALGGS